MSSHTTVSAVNAPVSPAVPRSDHPGTPGAAVVTDAPSPDALPLWRLHLLRATYLLIAIGLGIDIWPAVFNHDKPWELMQGVVCCMLAAVSLLAVLGLAHPVRMLPLLLFELVWKAIWLSAVAVPLWLAGTMDPGTWETAAACLMGVIFPIVIPWRHVFATFAFGRGDRWR